MTASRDDGSPLVLAVDDDPAWTELLDAWLGDDYRVRTASNGMEALDAYTSDVDVVFLDRQMPGLNGYEVLEEFRERGATCPAVMLTAVDPDFNIVEIPFEEYLIKPVTEDEVRETVTRLLSLSEYSDDLREFYTVVAKIATLEAEYADDELQNDDRYHQLLERRDRYRQRIDRMGKSIDHEAAFRKIGDGIGNTDESGEPRSESVQAPSEGSGP